MRWSWKRAAVCAAAALLLALAGGAVCGAAEARRFTDRASRLAACFAIVGAPVGFAIGGLSGRRPRTKRADPPR